ncbi:hypothetical protein WR25_00047 [Diploscapter pachys]|uniref:Aquaporin n=1 Tax=Diploscapter pachys TaxID=2018661 RepID=A0A2A2KEE8_9BILA|nr:hypothetical protein WR25_00047 [Diploscapter pachys]
MSTSTSAHAATTSSHIRMADSLPPAEKLRSKIRIKNVVVRNALAEFVGTFLLVFIGIGATMQNILSHGAVNAPVQVNIGWGFALAFSIYVTYHISDQFTKTVGPNRTILGDRKTAECFTSFPALHVTRTTAFFDQLVGTGLLVFFIVAILDRRNRIPQAAHPLLIGFVVMMIGMSYGMNVGAPINPARDFGPRIVAAFIYGTGVWQYNNFYFWIPIVAPLVGAILATWLYQFTLGSHLPDLVVHEQVPVDESKQPLKNG